MKKNNNTLLFVIISRINCLLNVEKLSKDRVAFITGGAGGMVCLVDIRADLGETVTKKLQNDFGKSNVLFVKCDITNDKEFEACSTISYFHSFYLQDERASLGTLLTFQITVMSTSL
ncbi:hypothetical protein Avbf_12964 [Armadillidium vulgare]|nr:hypothetical protein Avbf_12964 [Armadillidium vulgare]